MRFLNELHEGDRINGIYLCKQKQRSEEHTSELQSRE